MGEARHNPNSQQYRGPLPEFLINVGLGYVLMPPQEWQDANKEALAGPNPPSPPPEICALQIVAVGQMAYPSALVPQQHWPAAATAIAPLATVPFVEFKKRIDDLIAGANAANGPAPTAKA